MRPLFLFLFLCAAAAFAADPEGTLTLDLVPGESAPIAPKPPASVICDDPSVVTAEFTPDGEGFALHALKRGTTLCGVWRPDQVPGGLYRVNVAPAEPPDAGPSDAGVAADGGVATDGGVAADGGVASPRR